jgi:TRAP transporter TAXI family solute receptor
MWRLTGFLQPLAVTGLAFACVSVTACAKPADAPKTHKTLRVVTYNANTLNHQVVAALAAPLRDRFINIEVTPGTGRGNVRTLQHGEADIALAAADAVYYSYVGEFESNEPAFTEMRGIAVLQVTAAVLVAGPNSGIHHFSDLQGHSVNVGIPDGSLIRMAKAALEAYGVDATLRTLTFDEASQQLKNGTLDATFASAPLDGTGLEDLTSAGARLLPISGPILDQLLQEFPFWRAAVVRPRLGAQPIITVGGVNTFVCSKDLDAQLVYEFTKSFVELLPTLSSDLGLRPLDAESVAATPVPLHEGAARYYRERETLR